MASQVIEYAVRFPPFPKVSQGAHITPFKLFNERGISVFPGTDGETEVDSIGIATVKIQNNHDGDFCKTQTRRKPETQTLLVGSGAMSSTGVAGASRVSKTWWDSWQEAEEKRIVYRAFSPEPVYAFEQAGSEFEKGRPWPSNPKTRNMWDEFRKYSGLIPGGPCSRKTNTQPIIEYDDDDDFESEERIGVSKSRPESRMSIVDDGMGSSDQTKARLFVDYPEKQTRIWLSSGWMDRGYNWERRTLDWSARLLGFFLGFIVRNHAIPSKQAKFEDALKVVDLALRQLLATWEIGSVLPGSFSEGCSLLWAVTNAPEDSGLFPPVPSTTSDNSVVSTAHTYEPNPWSSSSAAVEQSWGTSGGGWGTPPGSPDDLGSKGGWGSLGTQYPVASAKQAEPLFEPEPLKAEDPWSASNAFELLALGPTALPLTHTTGVMEWSIRRIKSILPPIAVTPTVDEGYDGPRASAVERVLDSFVKVVMEPWGSAYDYGDKVVRILPRSRGDCVDPCAMEDSEMKGHNPLTDDIVVLVPAEAQSKLIVGMGLGANWTQIVRSAVVDGETVPARPSSSARDFWYFEQLMEILPSYYLPSGK